MSEEQGATRRHAAGIVAAYASHHQLPFDQVGPLIMTVRTALAHLGEAAATALENDRKPAVSVRQSVHRDYVVCLQCGFKAKVLRRHLSDAHSLTPDQYRTRWNLPSGHPIVALGYSEMRSMTAKRIGLGRSRKQSAKVKTAKAAETPRRLRGRPRSAKS